jgi:hypothetical protein
MTFSNMGRRRFGAVIAAPVISGLVAACSSSDSGSRTGSIVGPGNSSNNSGGSSSSSTTRYTPQVNSEPLFAPEHYLGGKRTYEGLVSFNYGGQNLEFEVIDTSGKKLGGVDVALYQDSHVNPAGIVLIKDPSRTYAPSIESLTQVISGKTSRNVSGTEPHKIVFDRTSGSELVFNFAEGVFVRELEKRIPRPEWELERMQNSPALLYRGNWSFNDLKALNTLLRDSSGLITLVAPNPVTATAFGVLCKTGAVLSEIDIAIDIINKYFLSPEHELDRDKKYPIYDINLSLGWTDDALYALFVDTKETPQSTIADIRDFSPLTVGNSWTYTDGRQSISSTLAREETIGGKKLAVLRTETGTEIYVGYHGNVLKQFGEKDPTLGRVFYDPAIVVGDDRMKIGKKYPNNAQLIFENFPNASGSIISNVEIIGKEDVIVGGTPYGGCLRGSVSQSLTVSVNGESDSILLDSEQWLAKGVGKVRATIPKHGFRAELKDARIINQYHQANGLAKPVPESDQGPAQFSTFTPRMRQIVLSS